MTGRKITLTSDRDPTDRSIIDPTLEGQAMTTPLDAATQAGKRICGCPSSGVVIRQALRAAALAAMPEVPPLEFLHDPGKAYRDLRARLLGDER